MRRLARNVMLVLLAGCGRTVTAPACDLVAPVHADTVRAADGTITGILIACGGR